MNMQIRFGYLRKTVFKDKYKNLLEYLHGFKYTSAVMSDRESIERISYEFAQDNFAEGVRYVEPRFAPQLHVTDDMSMDDVIVSVDRGLNKAKKEINSRKTIKNGIEPPFDYSIICCAMRMFTEGFSEYYKRYVGLHPHMPSYELFGLASLDLVETMIYVRDELGIAVSAFDLAGAESGYPAEDYKKAYELAHKNFFKKTVHAGEAYGPESIFQAITDCHADRIGHGTHIFDDTMVNLSDESERKLYVEELWQYVADSRITIEVCPTSNLQTMPKLSSVKKHPLGEMIDKRISLTFCTDNRLISNTTVTNEIALVVDNFEIKPKKLKDIIIYGFKRSFYFGGYLNKRRYVRQIIDYYEKIEKEFNVGK
jgi:adenosine deaminase